MPKSDDDTDQGTTRMFCWNDGCEVKDIRIMFASSARCPECGSELKSAPYQRPIRKTSTY